MKVEKNLSIITCIAVFGTVMFMNNDSLKKESYSLNEMNYANAVETYTTKRMISTTTERTMKAVRPWKTVNLESNGIVWAQYLEQRDHIEVQAYYTSDTRDFNPVDFFDYDGRNLMNPDSDEDDNDSSSGFIHDGLFYAPLNSVSILSDYTNVEIASEVLGLPVTIIRSGAFADIKCLNYIKIPETVSSIGEKAFCNCKVLNDIVIMNPECDIYDSENTISNAKEPNSFTGTIHGYKNSTAQKYAEKYGYKFEAIEDSAATTTVVSATTAVSRVTTVTTTKAPVREPEKIGDPNGDGAINANDATYVLVSYSELSTGGELKLSEKQSWASDVNNDGKIDAADATLILQYYAYLSTGGEDLFVRFVASMEQVNESSYIGKWECERIISDGKMIVGDYNGIPVYTSLRIEFFSDHTAEMLTAISPDYKIRFTWQIDNKTVVMTNMEDKDEEKSLLSILGSNSLFYLEGTDSELWYLKKVSDFTPYTKDALLKDIGL